jgi:16S rRNA (uracil1498-N3)-methyltransferase
MMFSLRRREYMSYARSPRFVFSMTVGMSMDMGLDYSRLVDSETIYKKTQECNTVTRMRLHRFFIDRAIEEAGVQHFSDAEMAHQLRRVFRLHEGDKAIFFDGSGTDHVCEIVSFAKDEVAVRVLESVPAKRFSDKKVALAMSLIKKDNFEWVIQKGTELGVSEFIPLISERSEKKGFNMERARKIMIEACEQSGRGDMPTVAEPVALQDFLAAERRPLAVFHTQGAAMFPENIPGAKDIVICIGPEGGWSDAEIESFKEKGASAVRLNAPVLRAETAAVSAASLLLLL